MFPDTLTMTARVTVSGVYSVQSTEGRVTLSCTVQPGCQRPAAFYYYDITMTGAMLPCDGAVLALSSPSYCIMKNRSMTLCKGRLLLLIIFPTADREAETMRG